MRPLELTVGVVSYNTRDLTCRCLGCVLKAMRRRTGTVVLADNGSTDGTLEAVASAFPDVVRLSFPENPGYGGALNRALARYPARFFLAMNADVLLAVITALPVGMWLSALNVQYRDIRYTIPFLTQLWLFVTPVAYPSSLLPQALRSVYGLNPMAGVIEGFRWALLGQTRAPGPLIAVSTLAVLVLLVGGVWYFNRTEQTFADIV